MRIAAIACGVAAAALFSAEPTHASLPLASCTVQGVKARCGVLMVPENRMLPAGRTIPLRIVVLLATGKPVRRDPFVYLAGGPGSAATQLTAGVNSIWYGLRANRDFLLVDQRGTGASNPLACSLPDFPITTPEQVFAYVQSCTTALGGDATQYGTAAAADDLEDARVALGYGKLNVYGTSYGATAAQVFLRRHPGSVRTVVLDGGTLLDIPFMVRFGSNGERALDLIAKRCSASRACAAAFPAWRTQLSLLLARLKADPAPVQVGPESAVVDDATFAGVVQTMTKTASDAASIPLLVARTAAGDYSMLRGWLSGTSSPPDLRVMPWSIKCNEPWWGLDPAAAAADARGTYLESYVAYSIASDQAVCAGFPKRPEAAADWTHPHSTVPALALVGGADPQDPIGNIGGLRDTMPNARIIVAPGQGHGVGQFGCLPNLVLRFVQLGSAKAVDPACVRAIGTPPFVLR